MDGKSRVLEQTRNGVRELVQQVDELRVIYGVSSVRVLTPSAEVAFTLLHFVCCTLLYVIDENSIRTASESSTQI